MADDEGLSIEETNKLRISLGLKPLNVASHASAGTNPDVPLTSEQQEKQAVENLRKKQEEDERNRQKQDTANRIRKAKEKAERNRKLAGLTLGDEDGEDTLAWLRRTRDAKPQVKETPVPKKPVVLDYSEEHLDGLRVGHDMEDLEGGNEIVLTLKDGDVLDDDRGDELVNVDLIENENLQKKLESKKRKSVYTTYEDDEIDPETGKKKILARYDEDGDDGSKKKSGFSINKASAAAITQERSQTAAANGRVAISLESLHTARPAESDYAEPVKIKKPKKRKTIRRQKSTEENANGMTNDEIEQSPMIDTQSASFVDDDDLQASLARQRRLAAQKRAILKPDEILSALPSVEDSVLPDDGGLVLDETTEFTRGLQDIKLPELKPKREASSPEVKRGSSVIEEDGQDTVMQDNTAEAPKPEISAMGIDEETTLDRGIGAAMAMLRQKGVFQEDQSESTLRQSKEAWLVKDKRIRMELELERKRVREEMRNSPRFKNMSAREREAFAASENRRLDALEAKATQERFKDYKPSVDIKYVDDFGRNMNQKQAFKHMSHQFHGKDSGSGKTAKKLAQIEKEKANEQKSLFSTR